MPLSSSPQPPLAGHCPQTIKKKNHVARPDCNCSQLTTATLVPPTLPPPFPNPSARSISQQQAVLSALASPASPGGPGKGFPPPPLPRAGKQVLNGTPRRTAALSARLVTSRAPRRQSSALAKSCRQARRRPYALLLTSPSESPRGRARIPGCSQREGGRRRLPRPPRYSRYPGSRTGLVQASSAGHTWSPAKVLHYLGAAAPGSQRRWQRTVQHGCLSPAFQTEAKEEPMPDMFLHYQLYQAVVHLSGWV